MTASVRQSIFSMIAPSWTTDSFKENIMRRFVQSLARCRPVQSQAGVTAIEYGLIAALIAIAIVTAVTLVGTNLSTLFTSVAGKV
jgi:pilus assembly protein Flp/PilA